MNFQEFHKREKIPCVQIKKHGHANLVNID